MRIPTPQIQDFATGAVGNSFAQALGGAVYPSAPKAPATQPSVSRADVDQIVYRAPMTGATELMPPMDFSSPQVPELGASEFGPLMDDPLADYKSVYEGLDPVVAAFTERAAKRAPARRNEEQVLIGGIRGQTPDEQDKIRRQDAVRSSFQRTLSNPNLSDDQFNSLVQQYQQRLGLAPQIPNLNLRPTAPNAAQLGVAGLAALLNPGAAAELLATPFQAQQQDAQLRQQEALQRYQIESQQHGQDMNAYQDLLRLQSQRDATKANLDVQMRGQDEVTKRGVLSDISDAKTPAALQQAFAAMDAAGLGDLVPQEVRADRIAEAQTAVDEAAKAKKVAGDESRIRQYVDAALDPVALPEGRVTSIDQALAIIKSNDPTDPRIAQLEARRKLFAAPSQKQIDDSAKAQSTVALNKKRSTEIDARMKSLGVKYKIDSKRLATYDEEFREKIAARQAARRDIESRIAKRTLDGNNAVLKAQGKLGGGSGLSKEDVGLLKAESQALAKEASVLRAQRNALADRFTGDIRKGSEATAADLDKRIAVNSRRQSQIGKTFRINREESQRARAAMPPTLGGSVRKGQIGVDPVTPQLPSGWSFGRKT